MAVSTKMAVFWVVAPYSLVEVYHFIIIALMMGAARTSETLVKFTRLHGATTQKTAIKKSYFPSIHQYVPTTGIKRNMDVYLINNI
jgi:hypothetical protein